MKSPTAERAAAARDIEAPHTIIAVLRVTLAALILAGCQSGSGSLDSEYREAKSLFLTERYKPALLKAQNGFTSAEKRGSEKDRWRFRLLKADILIGQRFSAKALEFIDTFHEPPNGREWANERAHVLLLRGRASSELNRLPEADALLSRAAAAAREAASESLATEVGLRQGRVLIQRARFEEARRVFQKAATDAVRIHDPYLEAAAVGNFAFALLSESRNDEAIPWFERAIALFTKSGAGESIARTHGNLGTCYLRLGDYDNAALHYDKAQRWFGETGNLESQQIWIGNAGNLAFATGDIAGAARAYQQALRIAREVPSPVWVARWVNNLAATSLEQGDWDAAEKYNNQALAAMHALGDTRWEPISLMNAARVEEGRGNFDRARTLFHSALSMKAEDPAMPLDSHAGLARTWLREGRFKQAEDEFRAAVALIENRRASLIEEDYKLPYLSTLIRFYQEYVDFLIDSHQQERALEIAESSRAQVLESRVEHAPGVAPVRTADYRRLARSMHSVALEYWLGPKRSYLWVVTGQGIRFYELPPKAELHSLIESYRAVVAGARNPLEVAGETGRRLYQALLGHVDEASRTGKFLIVPDGDLYYFSFESLPAPGDPRKYWIEEAVVSTAPSLNYLAGRTHSQASKPARGLLAMGDVPAVGAQYPRLEYAGREIDLVARNAQASSSAILRGSDATPAAYAAALPGRFDWIHFAAHAAANPLKPLDSAVILSGPPDANRLLARSVMAVPLTAQLVTISACRSAGGKAYAGEGLVGFAWAFLRAGARNVIAGLWDVSDRSTSELMSSLYGHIAAGDNPAAALRASKIELIRKGGAYARPFYWAAFQVYVGSAD